MTLREKLHEIIDQADEAALAHLAKQLFLEKEPTASKDIDETITLWEILAEPMAPEHHFPVVSKKTDGKRVAAILQEIADSGGIGIESPQEWQREVRKDRPSPFRG